MNRWKFAVIILATCIIALVIGGALWVQKDRERTRVATLRSLYDYLSPSPQEHTSAAIEPIVLDLAYKNNQLQYIVHGQTMDLAKLRQFIKDALAVTADYLPIFVRPTVETPPSKIVAMLRFLAANRVKWFALSMDDKEWIVLTDRNFEKPADLPASAFRRD